MENPYADLGKAPGTAATPATPQYYSPIKSANLTGMNPQYMDAFTQMAQDFYQQTGKPITINDAWRSTETQAKAYSDWKAGIKKAPVVAPPGHSRHESGLAMDIDSEQANQLAKLGLLEKYGFDRPVKGEPWHIQLADSIRKAEAIAAKENPYADLGKPAGGAGLSSMNNPYADLGKPGAATYQKKTKTPEQKSWWQGIGESAAKAFPDLKAGAQQVLSEKPSQVYEGKIEKEVPTEKRRLTDPIKGHWESHEVPADWSNVTAKQIEYKWIPITPTGQGDTSKDYGGDTLAEFSGPAGEAVGKAMDVPFIPLHMARDYVVKQAEKLGGPFTFKPEMSFGDLVKSMLGKETKGDEPPTMAEVAGGAGELLAFPSYTKGLIKGGEYLGDIGKMAFYRYAPDMVFKSTAKGGLPYKPLSEGEWARLSPEAKEASIAARLKPEKPVTPEADPAGMAENKDAIVQDIMKSSGVDKPTAEKAFQEEFTAKEPTPDPKPKEPVKPEPTKIPVVKSERSAKQAVRVVDDLLVRRAIEKAQASGDDYNLTRFQGIKPTGKSKFLTPAERNDLNMYIFGDTEGRPAEVLLKQQPKEPGAGKLYGGGPETSGFVKEVAEDTAAIAKAIPEKTREIGSTVKQAATNLWNWYAKTPEWTNFKDIIGKYTGARQIANFENRKIVNRINSVVPDRLSQEGITNYIEAGADNNILKQRADATKDATLKRSYEVAQNLTDAQKEIAQEISDYFDRMLQEAIAHDVLEDGVDNYVNHVWAKENPVGQRLRAEANSGLLRTSFDNAKRRIFESYFEGEQAGFVPKDKRIGYLIAKYHQSFYEAVAARKAIKALQEGVASDGRPLVEVSGSGKQIPSAEATEAYLVRPKILPEETADYRYINHPALRKWKWVSKDIDGNPIFLQGDMYVHPEIYQHMKNMLGKSAVAQHPVGRGVLGTVRELKGTLLSFSGFHQMQEGLHAVFHKVNPFNAPPIDFNNPLQKKLVEHGLMVSDHGALMDFVEGVGNSGLPNKIPGIGRWLKSYQSWLFEDYIPRLKMKMATDAYERNVQRYWQRLSDDQILELTGKQSNAAFGELNYKMMGRNPTTQDVFRLINLAPDFLEARAKFVGQAFRPDGREQAAALIRGAIGLTLAAGLANMVLSKDHKPHLEKPLTVLIGDREYSLRSVPGDLIHLLSDQRSFVYHRLNPTVMRPFIEFVTGRDLFGRKRDFTEQFKDFFVSHVPIPIQGHFNKSEQNLMVTALQSIGVSSWQHRSDAEKAMMDWHIQWARLNITDPKKKEAMRYERDAMQAFDNGDKKRAKDILDVAVAEKVFSKDKAKAITKKASVPKLKRSFKTITDIDEQMRIFGMATDEEKAIFAPILMKRIDNLEDRDPHKYREVKGFKAEIRRQRKRKIEDKEEMAE